MPKNVNNLKIFPKYIWQTSFNTVSIVANNRCMLMYLHLFYQACLMIDVEGEYH